MPVPTASRFQSAGADQASSKVLPDQMFAISGRVGVFQDASEGSYQRRQAGGRGLFREGCQVRFDKAGEGRSGDKFATWSPKEYVPFRSVMQVRGVSARLTIAPCIGAWVVLSLTVPFIDIAAALTVKSIPAMETNVQADLRNISLRAVKKNGSPSENIVY